jgi:pilus assembly protein Flp/PilA
MSPWTGCIGAIQIAYAGGDADQRESANKEREGRKMNKLVKRFLKSEDGVTALEYGLIAGLIAVAIVASVTGLGSALTRVFESIASSI